MTDITLAELLAQFGLSTIFLVISYFLWRDVQSERGKNDALHADLLAAFSANTRAFDKAAEESRALIKAIDANTRTLNQLSDFIISSK